MKDTERETDLYLELKLFKVFNSFIKHRSLISLPHNNPPQSKNNESCSSLIKYCRRNQCTLLEFGIRFCKAFNFSLILLLLLCSQQTPHQT